MSWVTSPDYENTLGGHRRRRRKELEAGVRSDLDALGGGFDALDKAVKAAGLETERKEDRSKEKADALTKAEREAEAWNLKKEDRARSIKQGDEDRARKLPLDDLERKLMEAKIDATVNPKESPRERFLRETAAGKARTEEEASGEAERRKKAKRVLEAAEAAGTDPDDAAAMVESLRTEDAFSEDELNEIRTEITREQEDRRLTKEKREAEIGAINRRGVPKAGGGGGGVMADLKRQKLEADLSLSQARAQAAKTNTGAGGKAPTTQEALAVSELDTLLGNVGQIRSMKDGLDTGPIAGRLGVLRTKVGMGDPKVTAFRAEVGSQLADYIKGISGAAASDKERGFLEQNVPNVNDSDEEFLAKLDRLEVWAARKRQTLLNALQAAKRDVSGFEGGGAAPAQQAAPEDDGALMDAIMDEHPDWSDEQVADELERRKRNG